MEKLQFDLVITDIQLPEMNGFHFVTLFNEKYTVAPLPVLAITGRRDVPESFYTKSGFSGILPKPFTPEKFYEKLKVFFPNLNTEVEHKPIMVMPYNNTNGYTPEVLESFMGDDIEGIVGIYKHFLSETEENLQKLEASAKMQDYATIKSIAHKMTSMFAQINAQRESEILIVLNKVDKEVPEDLEEKIKNLTHFFKEDCRPIIENYLSSFSGGNL